MTTKDAAKDIESKLENLRKLALTLDQACKTGSIDTSAISEAQDALNDAADSIINDESIDTDAYIMYEVQGLIHWVKGEYDDAALLIKSALITKKDKKLFTDTATELASREALKKKHDAQSVMQIIVIVLLIGLVLYPVVRLLLFLYGPIGWEYSGGASNF